MKAKTWTLLLVALLSFGLMAGCAKTGGGGSASGKLKVTATTGMIADVVKNVGGEHVEVVALMGPGVDPHLYKASEGDISKMQSAKLIFYNGLNLEGKLGDILVKMARTRPTIPVSEEIPQNLILDDGQGHPDPHVWFDVTLWMRATEVVRDGLSEADPKHKTDYEKNAAAYLAKLDELHTWAKAELAKVPAEQRVLVTAHDAFSYFGRAYGVEVLGLQGISTDAEYGIKDVQRLVDVLTQRKIKAVFVESSISDRSIKAVVEGAKAKGHTVAIGGQLYSDAMGAEGTPDGTYIGMVRANVNTIVGALK